MGSGALKAISNIKDTNQFCTSKEVHMICHRCGGIMIYQKFYGYCEHFFGWRCIVCGEIIDQVILENRLECLSFQGG